MTVLAAGGHRRLLAIAFAVVLPAVPLAGCVGSDAPSGPAGPTVDAGDGAGNGTDRPGDNATRANATGGPAVPSRLSFGGCTVHLGLFFVPAAFIAEQVPPGFSPASQDPAGGTATVVAVGAACGNATSDGFDGPVDGVGAMTFFLAVDPPDEYEDGDLADHLLHIATANTFPEVVQVQQAWNLTSVEEGGVDLVETATAAARTGQVEARSENVSATLHTATESGATASAEPGFTARLYAVPDGEVTDVVDINVSAYNRTEGTAKMVFEPFGTGPADLAFWAATNAVTTGMGVHYVADGLQVDHWRRAPAQVTGPG